MGTLSKPRKQLAAGIFFLAALVSMMLVKYYYTWYMPTSEETASGRIFAVTVYFGKIVFVTSIEKMILLGTYIGMGMAILVVAVTMYVTRERFEETRKPGPD